MSLQVGICVREARARSVGGVLLMLVFGKNRRMLKDTYCTLPGASKQITVRMQGPSKNFWRRISRRLINYAARQQRNTVFVAKWPRHPRPRREVRMSRSISQLSPNLTHPRNLRQLKSSPTRSLPSPQRLRNQGNHRRKRFQALVAHSPRSWNHQEEKDQNAHTTTSRTPTTSTRKGRCNHQ